MSVPFADDVRKELARIEQSALLSPQERGLLRVIVERTLRGEAGDLYQKRLATDLGIRNAKQIGVIASRLRDKLRDSGPLPESGIRITLPEWGYEAQFTQLQPGPALSPRAQMLAANARAAIDLRTLNGAGTALRFLDDALESDPTHALLLALKAYCLATRALYGTHARTDLEQAEALVARTKLVLARPWESWFAEGCVRMALHWDWSGAGDALARANQISGGEAQYQPWFTAYLASQGRASEAVRLLQAALTRSPDSPAVRADLAAAQVYAGDMDDAQETISTAFELFGPRAHYLLHVHQAMIQEARGESLAALDTIKRIPLPWHQSAVTLGMRGLFSGLAGNQSVARRHFHKLRAARTVIGRHLPAGQLGLAAYGAGDHDTALYWLREGAVTERDPNFILVNAYPFFRHLHSHPGFQALVCTEMGLTLPAGHT